MMDPNHLPVADSAPYRAALEQCLDHWGLVPDKTELIRDGVNHVFGSEAADGSPVIVRIGEGAVRSHAEVEGELLWLDHLLRKGCTVTTPIRSRQGEIIESVKLETGTFHACCFERFQGHELDPRRDAEWNDELFLALGREIGRIHRASDQFRLPRGRDRKPWYESEFSRIPDPLPAGFLPEVARAMQDFTDEMRSRPQKARHYGLIHRDIHAGNFLVERGQVQMIDFDLGGYGWRAMDFSVLLFAHYFYPSGRVPGASSEVAGKVLSTLVRGYRDEYILDAEQLETIDDLLKLREIVIYIASITDPDYWQVAMGDPQPSVRESLAWIERNWLEGSGRRVDLGQL